MEVFFQTFVGIPSRFTYHFHKSHHTFKQSYVTRRLDTLNAYKILVEIGR